MLRNLKYRENVRRPFVSHLALSSRPASLNLVYAIYASLHLLNISPSTLVQPAPPPTLAPLAQPHEIRSTAAPSRVSPPLALPPPPPLLVHPLNRPIVLLTRLSGQLEARVDEDLKPVLLTWNHLARTPSLRYVGSRRPIKDPVHVEGMEEELDVDAARLPARLSGICGGLGGRGFFMLSERLSAPFPAFDRSRGLIKASELLDDLDDPGWAEDWGDMVSHSAVAWSFSSLSCLPCCVLASEFIRHAPLQLLEAEQRAILPRKLRSLDVEDEDVAKP